MSKWKTLSLVLVAAALLTFTAACGSNGDTANKNGANAGTADNAGDTAKADDSANAGNAGTAANAGNDKPAGARNAAADQPETRTYKDSAGNEITVPSAPQKLVAINYVGDMLALGVKPAYTTAYELDTYGDALSGAVSIGDRPVNMESLLALSPDLIVSDDTDEANVVDQLKKISPTVILPFWTPDPYEHLRAVADLLDKKPEAEQWIAKYEAKAAATKALIHPDGESKETALLLIISGKDMGISGVRNGGFTLYRQLGFQPPAKMEPLLKKDENFGWETVTLESLTTFAPDRLFVEMDDTGEATKSTFEALKKSAVWQSLAAVKSGKVYEVTNKWGLGDATSLDAQLDETTAHLTGK
ncbi:ABC transporter substrate-binding protein [Paenibacillus lycopersici]|uniref:ABC transporter substrate-binding protein n=1 Tax=Paenibacillus lycopersici TaxID=2704462 RepID=A0A6C0FV69_9BACL|nr:ABC transporter substrate-binding protein [Paenibacillus lycopersici]QHT61026.1 ABC transporter substrate-binding protein [Paenibacillus lycopersici]